ncbi:uncharacterized protein DS421_20g695210 [Arachis hypogaea]|nr:uncharacterized protein DS421_20g695210 [Arachis hypogaea]
MGLAAGDSPPWWVRSDGDGVSLGALDQDLCISGMKPRRGRTGFDQNGAREALREGESGGDGARETVLMDDGLVVLPSSGGMDSVLATSGPDAGCPKDMACGQMVRDGLSLGNPRVEIILNGGGVGKQRSGSEGEGCGEDNGKGGSKGAADSVLGGVGEHLADSMNDTGEIGREPEPEVSANSKREAEMKENREAWKLAVESGAVQYDEEDDIMAILQAQNEALAEKKRLAKQKEKARRSRPKNQRKVFSG